MKHSVGIALVFPLLLLPVTVSATDLSCNIHLSKNTADSALSDLAKVTEGDARKAALAILKTPPGTTAEGELEIERGCLIYSYDVQVPGHSGVEEVWVDAGTGKVLSQKHEGVGKEAAEKLVDKKQAKQSH